MSLVGTIKAINTATGGIPHIIQLYMKKYGSNQVVGITIERLPVVKMIQKLLNSVSSGQLEAEKKRLSYDDLYHLQCILSMKNGHKIKIHKVAKVEFILDAKENPKAERIKRDVNSVPFNEMITRMEAEYKKENKPAWKYDALNSNCQLFILNICKALNIADPEVVEFVKQDTSGLLSPTLGKVAQATTTLAGVAQSFFGGGSQIQAVLFDNTKWTTTSSRRWLKAHKYTPIKRVHRTEQNLRYRLADPERFKRYSNKKTKDGIMFIIGYE